MADEVAEVETEVAEPNPLTGEVDSGEDTVELLGQDGAVDVDAQAPTKEDELQPGKAEGHRSPELQKIIDGKYGGSEEAFAKAVWEQQNSTAQVFQELKALREEMAAVKAKPEEAKADDDPDVSSLNDQRALVVEELEALKANHDEIVGEFNKLSEQKIRLETKLEVADDYDKPKHQEALDQAKARLADLKRQYAALPRESKRLTVQLSNLDRQIKSAQGAVQTRSKAKEKEAEQEKQWQGEFRSLVDQYIDSVAKDKGITSGTKVHARLGDYVRRSIYAHLASLDPDGPGVDPVRAVQHFSDEFLESLSEGAKVSFKTASATKQAATTPQARPSLPGAKVTKVKELTKEAIEAHKTAVLG